MDTPRILVVDDDDYQLLLLDSLLTEAGYEVTTLSSTREAIAMVKEADFDLAILDIVIDELDGFELCRIIKETPRSRDLPVIFLTGERGSLQMRLKGFEVGAVDYLLKPVSREELVARVRVMLELRRVQHELRDLADGLQEKVEERTAQLQSACHELERQKTLSESIVKSVPTALLVVDGSDRVVTWNRAFQLTFGSPDRGNALTGVDALRPLTLADDQASGLQEFRVALHTLAGDVRTFSVGVSPVDTDREVDDPGGRVFALTDITDRELAAAALRGREPAEILREMDEIRRELSGRYHMGGMVGFAPNMAKVTQDVEKLRQGRATVLIQGESGTGKELVARALHFDGPNAAKPFIPLHCGAISRELIESELFGHEKGSFTGAIRAKKGLFKSADGGTIFLDEVGEISSQTQIKLLRVLQEGTFMPVGSNETIQVDVRVIAATNKDLREEVQLGNFREDLFYRLAVILINVPPLRDRAGDAPPLVAHFIKKYNAIYGRKSNPVKDVSREVLATLNAHPWPGNVRELENVMVRAFELGCGEVIQLHDLPPYLEEKAAVGETVHYSPAGDELVVEIPNNQLSLGDFERIALIEALKRAGGDKLQAARELGIGKSTLYRKLKKFEIS